MNPREGLFKLLKLFFHSAFKALLNGFNKLESVFIPTNSVILIMKTSGFFFCPLCESV